MNRSALRGQVAGVAFPLFGDQEEILACAPAWVTEASPGVPMALRARIPHIVAVTDRRFLLFEDPGRQKLSMYDLVVEVPVTRIELTKTQSRLLYKLEIRIRPGLDEVTHERRRIVLEFRPRDRAAGRQFHERLHDVYPRDEALAPAVSETAPAFTGTAPTDATEDTPPTS
ncbi:MAG TPA: hypothetical protein VHP57_01010 [Acidimicrobiia bacterium]|nr:hypothetical protein [Acidimicrobiia bacterium]